MSAEFTVTGLDEIVADLDKMQAKFPATTQRVLQREARAVAKDLKVETSLQIKNHGRAKDGKGSRKKDKGDVKLEKSFQAGRVRFKSGQYTSAVTSKAPHYHLVELGHEPGGWHEKQKNARPVSGKKIVARYMAKRSEHSAIFAQAILDEVLNEVKGY